MPLPHAFWSILTDLGFEPAAIFHLVPDTNTVKEMTLPLAQTAFKMWHLKNCHNAFQNSYLHDPGLAMTTILLNFASGGDFCPHQ